LTVLCEKITGNKISIQEIKENRQADIRIYITDNKKSNGGNRMETRNNGRKKLVKDIHTWIKGERKRTY